MWDKVSQLVNQKDSYANTREMTKSFLWPHVGPWLGGASEDLALEVIQLSVGTTYFEALLYPVNGSNETLHAPKFSILLYFCLWFCYFFMLIKQHIFF